MSPLDEPSASSHSHVPATTNVRAADAVAAVAPSTPWQRAKFLFRAIEVRLRFIGLFVGIGLLMAYWTTLEAYWDRWTRPTSMSAADSDTEYYCPMHPNVIRPGLEPNGAVPNCPICGMPLSKRKKGEVPALPEGVLTRVQLSPERIQLAGVKTSPVSFMPLTQEVRTVGYVQYDESRLSEIVTRVGGYLEKLFINKTYAQVEAGQPLAEIYSPDLYSSIQELLLAKKHGSEDLVASARQRLKLLGIDDTGIDEAIAAREGGARLVIRSPQAGQVIQKNVVEGASVEPGTVLFQVADLATVWIEADVYERDLPFLHVDQEIEATVEALPGRTFSGQIALIYPQLDTETRTNRVRITIDNAELILRPGMFATVRVRTPLSETEPFKTQIAERQLPPASADEATLVAYQQTCPVTGLALGSMGAPIKVTAGDRTAYLCCAGCEEAFHANPDAFFAKLDAPPTDAVLSVPEQAVIDTGQHSVVYVEREPGLFEGVEVTLGPRSGGFYPVISGLSVGDRVAAAGSFLLDAETRLNPAAASAYFGASGGPSGDAAATGGTSGARRDSPKGAGHEISPAHRAQIDRLPEADRELAAAQAVCPVTGEPLGSMGVPVKVTVQGQIVFLCCQGCVAEIEAHPDKYLKQMKHDRSATPGEPPRGSSTATGHNH
jgi:Cu(I)/Ag(I) efflux system membrane fusion protein